MSPPCVSMSSLSKQDADLVRVFLQEAVTGNFTELSKLLADRGAKVSENGKVISFLQSKAYSSTNSNLFDGEHK